MKYEIFPDHYDEINQRFKTLTGYTARLEKETLVTA